MKTQNAVELFQYWNRLRGGAQAPARTKIEPSDIRNVLASTFILETTGDSDDLLFRLAGTAICNLLGNQLRGTSIRNLFQDKHKPVVSRLMRTCYNTGSVLLLGFDGTTRSGRSTIIEILMLPLQDENNGHRILGCMSPHQFQFWHGLEAVNTIELHSIRLIDPDREPLFLANRPAIGLPPALVPNEQQLQITPAASHKSKLQLMVIQGGKT